MSDEELESLATRLLGDLLPAHRLVPPFTRADEARARLVERLPYAGVSMALPGYSGASAGVDGAGDAPGFPFHTEAAELIWKIARELIPQYPECDPGQIFQLALEQSQIGLAELTPEDGRMLEIAIAWAQNGPAASTGNRIGGMPGGPFGASGPGYSGSRRGAQ